MIIHIVQSSVNNSLNAFRGRRRGRPTLLTLYLVCTSYRKLTHNRVPINLSEDVYSDYCRDKLTSETA